MKSIWYVILGINIGIGLIPTKGELSSNMIGFQKLKKK